MEGGLYQAESLSGGVSLGGFYPGALGAGEGVCPGDSLSREESLSKGVSVLENICMGVSF